MHPKGCARPGVLEENTRTSCHFFFPKNINYILLIFNILIHSSVLTWSVCQRVPHMVCMRCPEGRAGVWPHSRVNSGTLTCLLIFTIFQHIAVCLCPIKWIDKLYYLVLAKLTLTKQTSRLKRFLQINCGLKTILIMWTQANKKMSELTLLLLLLWVLHYKLKTMPT